LSLCFQNAVNLFRQLFHAEWLGNVWQLVAFQKLSRLRSYHISGDEQESLSQGIPRTLQRFIEMLSVETRHLHVANHQVKGLPRRALQSFAAVQQHLDMHPFVFQHVGDQTRDSRLILYHKYAHAFSRFEHRHVVILMPCNWRNLSSRFLPRLWRMPDGLLLQHFRSRWKLDLKYRATHRRANDVNVSAMFAHHAQNNREPQSCPLSSRLGGKKGIENPRKYRLRNSRTI